MVNKVTPIRVKDITDKEWYSLFGGIDMPEVLEWVCLLNGIDIFEMIWYKYFKLYYRIRKWMDMHAEKSESEKV